MKLRIILAICALVTSQAISSAFADTPARPPQQVRRAVERSLSLMQKSLSEYPRHATCFSCHHQGVPMFTLALARSHGYASAIDNNVVEAVVRHTSADLRSDLEAYRKGKGQPGGVTRAGYALLALQSGGASRDEVTAAVIGFLADRDKAQGFWHSSSNRPPSELSAFTDTFVAARALKAFGEDAQKDAVNQRVERARQWLEQTATKDTEDRVFRLMGLAEAGADSKIIGKASIELLAEQRSDGGWAQLPGTDTKEPGGGSDAYATGSALTALRMSGGLPPNDAAFQRGIAFLLRTQLPDGSWHVVSRSKPFQPYFESGFPHGKDQFISMAASGWATAALILDSRPAAPENAQLQQWPQFRGPRSTGVGSSPGLPTRWSATENVAWKTDIPGKGWSSPIVWGNRLFVTSVVNTGESEPPKKGLYFGGERPKPPSTEHLWKLICLDVNTGKVMWEQTAHHGEPKTSIHLKNSFASETPVTDGQRVYALFGNLGVFCYDLKGNAVWSKRFEPHKTRYGWGTAASPVVHRDRLYIVSDNDEQSYLLALDKHTGKEIWRVDRDEKSNWSSPFIWEHDGKAEIVTAGSGKVRSYDLDGKLLWWLTGMSSITIATPYAENGLLYISSGYVGDRSRPIYAIRPGATGDISLKPSQSGNEYIAWSKPSSGPYNPSTLLYDSRLYVLYDGGMVSCFKADTGSMLVDRERLPNGFHFTSSPWAYNGKVFCLNEDGVTFVLSAGDKFEVERTNALADDDMCMATPAIAGDRLMIRTSARIYCIRQTAR